MSPSSSSLIYAWLSLAFEMSLLSRLPQCRITDGDFIPDTDINNPHALLWYLPKCTEVVLIFGLLPT